MFMGWGLGLVKETFGACWGDECVVGMKSGI